MLILHSVGIIILTPLALQLLVVSLTLPRGCMTLVKLPRLALTLTAQLVPRYSLRFGTAKAAVFAITTRLMVAKVHLRQLAGLMTVAV
jgi:hypothetical protein